MLEIYGSPLSSPANKVCYVASFLQIPYQYHAISLAKGEHRTEEYLKINQYAKVPAINDDGFCLAESNAIIRYLADKHQSNLYPKELQQRALVDQWIDFATQHVMLASSKIMFNTYFYKMANIAQDERSLQDGHLFLNQYLPIVEHQLSKHPYMTGEQITLADIVMLAGLDTAELINIDLTVYSSINNWRKKLMSEKFYQDIHVSYVDTFNKLLSKQAA